MLHNDDRSHCCHCRTKTDDDSIELVRTKNDILRRKSTCKDCGCKKSRFLADKSGAGLTEDEKTESSLFAKLAGSAYESVENRRKFLDDNGLQDYSIHEDDTAHQNAHTAIYTTKDGKKTIAFRGTSPNDLGDLKADAAIASKNFHRSKRYRLWDNTLQDLRSKYGDDAINTLVGHSLGGRASLELGQKYGIKSHSFNVGTSPLEVQENVFKTLKCKLLPSSCNQLKKHTLWSNYVDPISVGAFVSPYRQRYIRPKGLNPHSITQWYQD